MEQSFYRRLSRCRTVETFSRRITEAIKDLAYSNYSFIGLSQADNPSGKPALVPTILLASYATQAGQHSAVMFQAAADSLRRSHLSMCYHFVANLAADSEFIQTGKDRYLLIVDKGGTSYYLAPCGVPALSCQVSISIPGKADNGVINAAGLADRQHPIDVIADVIAVLLRKTVPALYQVWRHDGRRQLTPQPRRLLNTMAHSDVNLRGAADILCLSTNTVSKHMAVAKSALGMTTIAGTLWAAAKNGIIEDG